MPSAFLIRCNRNQRGNAGRRREDRSIVEADIVSGRIVTLLESATTSPFRCTPDTLRMIHHSLFHGVLEDSWVGRWRVENIAKAEPVLAGRSVGYHDWRQIPSLLDFDFTEESRYRYTDIKTVQNRLGHSSASLTMNIYAHAIEQNDREAANAIGNVLGL